MRILAIFGTRPEWLKIKPILLANERAGSPLLIDTFFTGQHEDLCDFSGYVPTKIARIAEQDAYGRLDKIIFRTLENLSRESDNYDAILVQGDTASAFAGALYGFNNKMKVIHVEAGLRSYDLENPRPEEGYRQMISRITDIHFCPTWDEFQNLADENVGGKKFRVGNTALDNLVSLRHLAAYGFSVVVTLHRSENREIMQEWISAIDSVAEKHKGIGFVFPMHPLVAKMGLKTGNIRVMEHLSHEQMIHLLLPCRCIVTDSGGLQEEGSFLGKKVMVCRKITERPQGIRSGHLHLCKDPSNVSNILEKLIEKPEIFAICPYGDGDSAERIVDRLRIL